MNKDIQDSKPPKKFTQEVLDFILKNEKADLYKLLLKQSHFADFEMEIIVRQIQGRQIARKKFPFLLDFPQYIFPKKISLEQASSEKTALYKSTLISGNSFADLSGGMGIDCYLLGRKFAHATYVEPNSELFSNVKANFQALDFLCTMHQQKCEEFLAGNRERLDWLYLDPSRRVAGQKKTSIHNYEPNVVELKKQLLQSGENVLVKLSPMQDVSECISVLENVHHVWVISHKNEVKELLLHLSQSPNEDPIIRAVNIDNEVSVFESHYTQRVVAPNIGEVGKYIYQPSSAIVKAELQNQYASKLKLTKLHFNTQLYTAETLYPGFMGRVFEVRAVVKPNHKEVRKHIMDSKANVITKNFPLNPAQLAKKLKIKDGGVQYIVGYKASDNSKKIAVCNRLK